MTDRWKAETEELVARALYGRRIERSVDAGVVNVADWDWDNAPLTAESRRLWRVRAAGILTTLADAGLLLPPGGETRQEAEVEYRKLGRTRGGVNESTYRDWSPDARDRELSAAATLGYELVSERVRSVITYPDGAVHTGPWVAVSET